MGCSIFAPSLLSRGKSHRFQSQVKPKKAALEKLVPNPKFKLLH